MTSMLLKIMLFRRNGTSLKKAMEFTASSTNNTIDGSDLAQLVKTSLSTNKPTVDHGKSSTSSIMMVPSLMASTDSDKLNTHNSLPTSTKVMSLLPNSSKISGESLVMVMPTQFKVSEAATSWELLKIMKSMPLILLVMLKDGPLIRMMMATGVSEMLREAIGSESERLVVTAMFLS